jgi:hypothetical protein
MECFERQVGIAKRSRAGVLVCILFAILATVLPIGAASAACPSPVPPDTALPNCVIHSGTPVNLGQYCTAVLGSTSDPRCLGQLQGDTGDFKTECERVSQPVAMSYVAGNGLYSPQDRCIVGSSGGGTPHTISISASPSSCGTVSGGGTYNDGTTRTVTAVNNPGCLFSSWTENGTVMTFEASYTFTLVTNRVLVAYFGQGTANYNASVSAFPAAGGVVSGGGSYVAGSSATVTATANACYIFSSWTENGTVVSWAPSYTFPVVKDRNLVALFGSLMKTPRDFDGGGKSDILWRQNSGPVATWLMNGGAVAQSGGLGTVPGDWAIAGTGDFDGDGKADILWRNTTTGVLAIWLMNGTAVKQALTLGTVPTAWTIAGVGDFNFDLRADILWRDSGGTLAVWLIDASTLTNTGPIVTSSAAIGTVPADWKVAGVGDFDGDGRFDILWRQDAGAVALWLMDGVSVRQGIAIAAVGTDWTIAGVGDFDGDCKADILWRQSSGSVALWLMNGGALKSSTGVASVPTDWQIVGVGDFDGDHKADILWRQTGGAVALWLMNVGALKSGLSVATVATDWQIVK